MSISIRACSLPLWVTVIFHKMLVSSFGNFHTYVIFYLFFSFPPRIISNNNFISYIHIYIYIYVYVLLSLRSVIYFIWYDLILYCFNDAMNSVKHQKCWNEFRCRKFGKHFIYFTILLINEIYNSKKKFSKLFVLVCDIFSYSFFI